MIKNFTLPLILFVLSSVTGYSEGSKEIWIPPRETRLYLCSNFISKCNNGNGDRSQFAVYGCNEPDRLYFVTNSPNQAVYMGFQGSGAGFTNKIVFQIRNSAGTIVYTERDLPTGGAGYITNIGQAQVGPSQLYGAGGYTALSFHPPNPFDTYYIEFNRVNATTGNNQPGEFNLDLIDITVADTVAMLAKPGRLYCKSWQFAESGNDNCSATTYIYSNDSIITSCAFNNMSGGTWIQFCNQNGCGTTGNFVLDRMSVNTQVLLPDYKIFLNPPDPVLFPPASTLGQIIPPEPWGERFCNTGHITFHVNVDKPGNAEILLNFGAPYLSRTLSQAVVSGENLIEWDGLDGTLPTGQVVPNNVNITFTISYINGLTNLPFYDVEDNASGFVIDIVSPPGTTPQVFWDDSNIPGGTTNFTGCLSPPGCHSWSSNFGNLRTINTWWYNVSTTTAPATIVEFREPQPLVFNQSPPQSYCAGSNLILFSVNPDPNTNEYHWNYTGTGATINHANPSDAFITVSFAPNATSGSIEVYGTNTNCAINGPTSSIAVTIRPLPALDPPFTKSICSGTNTNMPLVSTPPGAVFTWTFPAPTCTPNIFVCPAGMINSTLINDVLGLTDLNPGSVEYHLTPVLNSCQGPVQNVTISVNPLPDVSNVILDFSLCNGGTTNIPLTSSVPATTFTWTATPSSPNLSGFSSSPGNLISDQLFNSGFTIETVTYAVTPSVNGCNGPVKNFVVTVKPTPDMTNMPPATQLCNNSFTNLTLTSNVAGALFTWTCSPSSANITGWSNNAVPTTLLNQFLTNLGLNTEWVTYSVTPSANGCFGNATEYTVTVVQSPDVFFNPAAQTICSQSASNLQVLSSVPGTTFTWTATPSSPNLSGQAPGSGNLIAQTVTNSGNTIESVTYAVTPTAFGCPPGNTQNAVLTVNPTPAISNSNTTSQMCSAATTNIVFTSTVPGSTFTWTASGSSPNVTGYVNGAGPSIVQTLVNTGFNIESATYQVAPTANGCPGNLTSFVVTVNPVSDVVFTPNGQSFCSGLASSVSLTSNVAGTSFTWTASGSGPSLSGFAPGSGNLIQQTLFNSGPFAEWATYQVSPTANGCPGTGNSVIVTVNPQPAVTVTPCFDPVVSVGSQAIPLRGNVPVGGTWSGPGVSGGSFIPSLAGPGIHVLNYSYTNTWGCAAGANVSITVTSLAPFLCGNTLTDVRDSKAYPTVLIGGQCWFAANLDYGATIHSGQMQRDNCVFEKYCFGDNPANCGTTGGLYQWDELMRYASNNGAQGFCPPEWHVPTEGDWNTLFSFYISNGFAGSSLKFTGFSGFDAMLTGTRFNNVQWDFNNFAVLYWSSTFHTARKAWAHGMNTFNPSVSFYPSHRNNAFPVRCIRD